jgi:hypothetical protein
VAWLAVFSAHTVAGQCRIFTVLPWLSARLNVYERRTTAFNDAITTAALECCLKPAPAQSTCFGIKSVSFGEAVRLSHRNRNAQDWGLIGLLTLASTNLNRLPDPVGDQWLQVLKFSAITVAGQWRILTALPLHQTDGFINPRMLKVKR